MCLFLPRDKISIPRPTQPRGKVSVPTPLPPRNRTSAPSLSRDKIVPSLVLPMDRPTENKAQSNPMIIKTQEMNSDPVGTTLRRRRCKSTSTPASEHLGQFLMSDISINFSLSS